MDRMKLHPLSSIIILAVCAVIGGANSWVAIEEFGKNYKQWFCSFLRVSVWNCKKITSHIQGYFYIFTYFISHPYL